MFNMSNLVIKDKAWRRVGVSPITYEYFVVLLLFRSTARSFQKIYMPCETIKEQLSGDPKCVA